MSVSVKMGEPIDVPIEDNTTLGKKALVVEDADILVSNPDHKNFTETGTKIPKGSIIFGKFVNVQGLRRGKPFEYRLFITTDNKIIYLNKVEIMRTTEVTLGADAAQTPTVVDLQKKKNFTAYTIGGAIIGGLVGNYIAKKRGGNKAIYIGVGALAGFFGGKMLEKSNIIVKRSK